MRSLPMFRRIFDASGISLVASLAVVVGLLAPGDLVGQDTPMLVASGRNTGVIDPGLGTMTMFEFLNSGSTRRGFCNWLTDLEQLERRVLDERNGEKFTILRVGSPVVRPTPEEFIQVYANKATKEQAAAEKKSLQAQVREAEKAFWEKPQPYDGIVRAAFAGDYLMLVVPSKRSVLFYQSNGKDNVELIGFTQFGPQLYLQTAWKSQPNPQDLIKQLNLTPDEQKAMVSAITSHSEANVAGAVASEIWCTAIQGGFVLVDSANNKIWSYEATSNKSIALTSVRSLSVDLLVPGYKTAPSDQASVDLFAKTYAAQIRDLGIDTLDVPYVKALLAAYRVGDSAKTGTLQASSAGGQVILNFTALNKVLTYEYRSGVGIELTTVRDLTVDNGINLVARLAQNKITAAQILAEATAKAGSNTADALDLVKSALALDPMLSKDLAKNSTLKNKLKADWDQLMASATQGEAELVAKREAIMKAAVEERGRAAALKKK